MSDVLQYCTCENAAQWHGGDPCPECIPYVPQAELTTLEAQVRRSLAMLDLYGVTSYRCKSDVANGIDVLVTRYRKYNDATEGQLERLTAQIAARDVAIREAPCPRRYGNCDTMNRAVPGEYDCNCWKRDALGET